jgi:hypothetical protein
MLADLLIVAFPALPPRVGSWYSDIFWDTILSIEIVPGDPNLLGGRYGFTHVELFEAYRLRSTERMLFLPWKEERSTTKGFIPQEEGPAILHELMWAERYYSFDYAVELITAEAGEKPKYAMKIHWFGKFDFATYFASLIDEQTKCLKSLAEEGWGRVELMARIDNAAAELKKQSSPKKP